MKKKQHGFFAWVLVVLIIIAMVASGGSMFFSGSGVPSSDTNTSTNATNSVADYQAQKVRIAAMAQQAKADPGNIPLQSALGNGYYDLGIAAQKVAPNEIQASFKQAVEAYQNVLKTNKDPNVMADMATAAFYSGDNDLAEKSFKEALAIKPDFYNGLVNYGVFLSQTKQDWAGALIQWQKAQNLAQNSSEKEQMNTLINQAQSQLKANKETNGMSNPTLNKGAENPVTPGK